MSCSCNCSDGCCTVAVKVRLLPILLGIALLFGLIRAVLWFSARISMPTTVWLPILVLAGVGSLWGLWLGYTVHRRGEALAVGLFGILLTCVGFLLYAPLVLIGVFVLLGAAIWSATARPTASSTG